MNDFDLEYVTESERALLVKDGEDGIGIWLAKSLIEYSVKSYKSGDPITVGVPGWLAEEKGLA